MKKIIALIAIFTPTVTFAQSSNLTAITDVNSLSSRLLSIGNVITYLLIALAVLFIVWNVVMYFIKSGEEADRKKAGMNILWGIVGLFVIVSIWGLVGILTNTFKTTSTNQNIPNLNNNNTGGIPTNTLPTVN